MEFWESVFKAAQGAAVSIVDVAPVKATVAGSLAFVSGSHGVAIVTLILIDLLTKYLSLSAQRLNDRSLPSGLWHCLFGIYAAIKEGYIKSELYQVCRQAHIIYGTGGCCCAG